MPDMNDKLDRFKQLVLNDAAKERDALQRQISRERDVRLREAEDQIKRETDAMVQSRARAITSETGRQISKRMLADKRIITNRREAIAQEVFAAVREKINAFTQTDDYLPHLKKLYAEAFKALGNPYDGEIWLRPSDMQYSRELAASLPGKHVTFKEGAFTLGGLIVDCPSRLLRADESYDTALGDLDGHFAELFGISLADD